MEALLHTELAPAAKARVEAPPPSPAPANDSAAEIAYRMEELGEPPAPTDKVSPEPPAGERAKAVQSILREMAADAGSAFRPTAALFQVFLTQCRKRHVSAGLDMSGFRRRFAMALAGLDRLPEREQEAIAELGSELEDDVLAPFLLIARTMAERGGGPDEEELSRVYGTNSPGRIRRLLEHLEKKGVILVREDYGGGRTLSVPGLEHART
jgi:hypothetical protein